MQLELSGHRLEITPALRSYVSKKFERLTRHFEGLIDIHCVLSVEKLRHIAEATVTLRGNKIHADATEGDMYAAIDALADKLDRRVKKHKEKSSDHHVEEAVRLRTP
jgi:putative sigma-54 modulation protein